MNRDFYYKMLSKTRAFAQISDRYEASKTETVCTGVSESARALITASLIHGARGKGKGGKGKGGQVVYVASNELYAQRIHDDLLYFLGGGILQLKPIEYMLYDVEARSSQTSADRVKVLKSILQGDWSVLVLSAGALMQWLADPVRITNSLLQIRKHDMIDPRDLVKKLVTMGYERVSQVDGYGQFSLRGDILDVYSYADELPVRIEFFDIEIDTVRYFDILSQRTVESVDEVEILPCRETQIWDQEHAAEVKQRMQLVALEAEKNFASRASQALAKRVRSDAEQIVPGAVFSGYDRYIPLITEQKYTIFDYTGEVSVIFDDPAAISSCIESCLGDHIKTCEILSEHSVILPQTYNMYIKQEDLMAISRERARSILKFDEFGSDKHAINVPCKSIAPFGGDIQRMKEAVKELVGQEYSVMVLAGSEVKAGKLSAEFGDIYSVGEGRLQIETGGIHEGFTLPESRFAVICDSALFRRERSASRKKLKGKAISSFADISEGDLVVHDLHGIGRFAGIESIKNDDTTRRDYIKILYRDGGILYVPTHQLSSVQKYIGPESSVTKLNKLGTLEWSNSKAKVKASLRAYAQELAELYAKRSKIKGYACAADTVWQSEFEQAFIYEETEDQLKCVEEIKADMESSKPMERLLCGDVGYGKTEVALRAAFKAICEGKQVAFLVPTTVLTLQHYNNFVKRFEDFPVKIEYLCRFKTAAQKKEILKKLEVGEIDLIVGTHSLIKNGIKFHDIGLLIIDEEQRFGVMHKDKIKQRYPAIDILSLTATPIPRTLHMSLSGIRDISIIEDPPRNRQPVQTYVAEWDAEMIRNAIYREMGRKGQIFYLYNSIEGMERKKQLLLSLVPEARIVIAHGQMDEHMLENIMMSFLEGEYDILLCTTIIESGLDMPNVNTIIIENSDRMGLAQLYQIRGRVGRSARLAYAYITYTKDKQLSEIAEKRLRSIRDFTEFGSGFKIALRDLEIRGAGSVLGEKQHGQLSAVGYDMYCKLLSEVIDQERGIPQKQEAQISVEFRVNAFIDSHYIEDEEARLDIYQRIARVEQAVDAEEIVDELVDRYGSVPLSVMNLIKISQIRYLASESGFTAVVQKQEQTHFILGQSGMKIPDILMRASPEFAAKYRKRIFYNAGKDPYLGLKMENNAGTSVIDGILEFMTEFSQICHCQDTQ